MQKWEYLFMSVYQDHWADSNGHNGKLPKIKAPGSNDFNNPCPVIASLGEQGWELAGTMAYHTDSYRLYFKRPKARPADE